MSELLKPVVRSYIHCGVFKSCSDWLLKTYLFCHKLKRKLLKSSLYLSLLLLVTVKEVVNRKKNKSFSGKTHTHTHIQNTLHTINYQHHLVIIDFIVPFSQQIVTYILKTLYWVWDVILYLGIPVSQWPCQPQCILHKCLRISLLIMSRCAYWFISVKRKSKINKTQPLWQTFKTLEIINIWLTNAGCSWYIHRNISIKLATRLKIFCKEG